MTHFDVEWALVASGDLDEIVTFIARDSPANAKRVLARIRAKASSLVRVPARGRVVPELQRLNIKSYRELIVGPYRLLYRIEGKKVYVVAVFDGRRDLTEVLLERFVRS